MGQTVDMVMLASATIIAAGSAKVICNEAYVNAMADSRQMGTAKEVQANAVF